MQFRQLRYFVKIVEAGSFSRAAALVHVAQPALSQQIAELESRLGAKLLHRTARGVRPTEAGEVLFREACSILHQLDQLPAVARSQSDDPEGTVSAGIASSLAPALVGVLIQKAHAKIPKVKLKVSDDDSETLEAAVDGSSLDLAVVYEDEFVSKFSRQPLFRQQLFLVGKENEFSGRSSVSLDEVAKIPLALPGLPNARRGLIDRVFAERSLPMNVVAETDSVSSELFAVKAGLAHTILPVNDRRGHIRDGFAEPLAIDADLFLTCSVISSSDLPLTRAGEAVRQLITEFIDAALLKSDFMGLQRLG